MSKATEVTGQIAMRLAGAPVADLDRAINDALALVGDYTGSDRTYLTQFFDDGTIEIQHEWLEPSYPPHGVAVGIADATTFSYSIDLAARGERFEISDIAALPDEARAEQTSFAAFNVTAVLQVPLRIDGQIVGVLGFNSLSPRDWSNIDNDLLDWTAQALAVAIERRRGAENVDRAEAEADRARHAAHHLLGRFSHELRTPLHVILGYTELLQLNATQPDDADALAQIQFNGRRLLALIDDLMMLDGDAEPEATLVPLTEVIDEVLDAIAQVTAHRQVTIDIDIDDSVALWFDRGRLRQVLYCQLAATVQNTPPGTKVTYSATPRGDHQAEVKMIVTSQTNEPLTAVAMPLAEALLDGEAELAVAHDTPARWTAAFTLPTASPD